MPRVLSTRARSSSAPAKINLTLRVLGRRADGYHELESLVVFAAVADELDACARRAAGARRSTVRPRPRPARSATIWCSRPRARSASASPGLTLGRFALDKRLPVAAGLGGGSSDAAAALRLLARVNGLALDDPRLIEAARATGADVPVCLDPRPRMMRGIGEVLSRAAGAAAAAAGAGQSRRAGADQGRVRQARPCRAASSARRAPPIRTAVATPDALLAYVASAGQRSRSRRRSRCSR